MSSSMSNKKSLLLGSLIVVLGFVVAAVIIRSAPTPHKVEPEVTARLVETQALTVRSGRPQWRAGGRVMAAQQVQLQPQVSGRIMTIADAAVPGATLQQGALLARIDPQDYELLLQQKQAAYIQAQADLEVEQGQAALAEEEYELSRQGSSSETLSAADKALILRQPQIARAKAALKTAQANVQQAQLDIQRTAIRMPFTGQINSRSIALGSQVSSSSAAFELVDVEQFWIEVKIPTAFLPWLDQDHAANISMPGWQGATRTARILNVLPEVDSADRQVRLILALPDPLAVDNPDLPPVLLNEFVEVTLFARQLEDIYQVASSQLTDADQVWVVNNGELQQRQLNVLYHGREFAWVNRGFMAGDELLISRIDAPVAGYPVRVLNADSRQENGQQENSQQINNSQE